MPKKRRQSKRPRMTLELLCHIIWRSSWEDYWGGEQKGRDAWEALRNEIRHHRGTRPGPFWWYDDAIPEELRHDPEPDHGPLNSDWPVEPTKYDLERQDLEERRAVWLRTVVPEEFDLEATDADP